MAASSTFTGRSRRRTRWSVRLADRLAHWLIATAGIGTIVAVLMVVVFLAWVVAPLLRPGTTSDPAVRPWQAHQTRYWVVADHGLLAWSVDATGVVRCIRLDGAHAGELLCEEKLAGTGELTALALAGNRQDLLLAYADGTLRAARVRFATRYLDTVENARLATLASGETAVQGRSLLHRTQAGQVRAEGLTVEVGPPIALNATERQPILWLDYLPRSIGPLACTLRSDGRLEAHTLRPLPEGELHYRAATQELARLPMNPAPRYLLLSGVGDNVFVVWEDGRLLRFHRTAEGGPVLPEKTDLVPEPGERLTLLTQLVGKTTLVAGDTLGRVRGWFRVRGLEHDARSAATQAAAAEAAEEEHAVAAAQLAGVGETATAAEGLRVASDGARMVAAHELAGPAEVRAVACSQRSRLLAAAYADGEVRLYYMTTGRLLARSRTPERKAPDWLALSPQDHMLWAAVDGRLCRWEVDIPHPEVSLAGLTMPCWYEGYDSPAHVWQSTGGDDFEPKFGLWPLVFGTLKATFYSMLFGAPLALLSAVYTSEFMSQRAKLRVKPVVELMASLPSVVLGFIAALVLAPIVARRLPEIMAWFGTLPLCCLLGAYLWQLVPGRLRTRLQAHRPVLIGLALAGGLMLGWAVARRLERLLFGGDMVQWLNGEGSHSLGGWLLLLLPSLAVVALLLVVAYVNPLLRGIMSRLRPSQAALLEAVKFVVAACVTLAAATLLAWLLERAGLDPRRSFFGTYEQTNSLVVGLMMGFAIVPIIYTLAEDALSAVPAHLRSASLGAGATPWQTAARIVIPTAASGLFSALMVGLGRAVGETMIVLMAAGGTPVLDINIFNGFRTLSANIAIELPEAVRHSTHYRLLFLTALVLFFMTFVLNTVAELVRQRFRKRAVQL
jgi:phosphate transport system permease protein